MVGKTPGETRASQFLSSEIVREAQSLKRSRLFEARACHSAFPAWRPTPLVSSENPLAPNETVLSALAEGLDASAAERVFDSRHSLARKQRSCTHDMEELALGSGQKLFSGIQASIDPYDYSIYVMKRLGLMKYCLNFDI